MGFSGTSFEGNDLLYLDSRKRGARLEVLINKVCKFFKSPNMVDQVANKSKS